MNEGVSEQLHIDFRTGRETAIVGAACGGGRRAASSALNRQRAKGIQEAARSTPSRQSVSADVWAAIVASRAREWAVPLIDIGCLGLKHDSDGLICSRFLSPLKSGAEACPFADYEHGVVYKLFPLRVNGGLGKTFEIERDDDQQGFVMDVRDAVLAETLEKLTILHDAGAHPTEIVGLDEMGDYLIVKQPLANGYGSLEENREAVLAAIDVARLAAVKALKAVPCKARFKRQVWVLWGDERPWILSDLHPGNIMKNAEGFPTLIDALLAPLPTAITLSDQFLREAVLDAREWRLSGKEPVRKAFGDGNDDDL